MPLKNRRIKVYRLLAALTRILQIGCSSRSALPAAARSMHRTTQPPAHAGLHGASGGDGEKFAQPQLPFWGPGPMSLLCVSWPRLFSRFCKAQGLWGVVIQVLAQKRAQDATLSFPKGSGFCVHGILWKKTLLSKPLLAFETYAPPKHPLEATLGAAGGARLGRTGFQQHLHARGAAFRCSQVERRQTSALRGGGTASGGPAFAGSRWSRENDPPKEKEEIPPSELMKKERRPAEAALQSTTCSPGFRAILVLCLPAGSSSSAACTQCFKWSKLPCRSSRISKRTPKKSSKLRPMIPPAPTPRNPQGH